MAIDNNKFFFDNVPRHILSADPDDAPAKLWAIFATQWDEIDFVFFQIGLINIIAQQSGINLDFIGSKIGLTRQGRDDATYKALLQITTVDEATDPDFVISTIVGLLNAEEIRLENDFPAGVIVKADNPVPVIPLTEVAALVKLLWKFARKYTITVTSGADGFAFDTVPGKGFDDFDAPGAGGIFSTIILSP